MSSPAQASDAPAGGIAPRAFWIAATLSPLVWALVRALASAHVDGLARAGRALGPFERGALEAYFWANRQFVPFGIAFFALGGPLLTLLAAWCLRAGWPSAPAFRRVVWTWTGVQLVSWALALWFPLASKAVVDLWLAAFASGTAAQAIVIAAAFRTQRRLKQQGLSRLPGGLVLWLGAILQMLWLWPGFLVIGIPMAHRRTERAAPLRDAACPARAV